MEYHHGISSVFNSLANPLQILRGGPLGVMRSLFRFKKRELILLIAAESFKGCYNLDIFKYVF